MKPDQLNQLNHDQLNEIQDYYSDIADDDVLDIIVNVTDELKESSNRAEKELEDFIKRLPENAIGFLAANL